MYKLSFIELFAFQIIVSISFSVQAQRVPLLNYKWDSNRKYISRNDVKEVRKYISYNDTNMTLMEYSIYSGDGVLLETGDLNTQILYYYNDDGFKVREETYKHMHNTVKRKLEEYNYFKDSCVIEVKNEDGLTEEMIAIKLNKNKTVKYQKYYASALQVDLSFEYDHQNNLKKCTSPSTERYLFYDSKNRLVKDSILTHLSIYDIPPYYRDSLNFPRTRIDLILTSFKNNKIIRQQFFRNNELIGVDYFSYCKNLLKREIHTDGSNRILRKITYEYKFW